MSSSLSFMRFVRRRKLRSCLKIKDSRGTLGGRRMWLEPDCNLASGESVIRHDSLENVFENWELKNRKCTPVVA